MKRQQDQFSWLAQMWAALMLTFVCDAVPDVVTVPVATIAVVEAR